MTRRVLEAGYKAAAPHPIYAVGGYVRDLLLGLGTVDIDLVVEGDAIAVARRIGEYLDAVVTPHPRFGTARLRLAERMVFDLATARSERYPGSAALPEVRPASLLEDLARRDFSINAMAARVDRHRFGPLIDPLGGLEDLRRGQIRVLHNGSFVDDPTRIFRAARFEARYGFAIARGTMRLLKAALGRRVMRHVAGSRIFTELLLIAKEPSAPRVIKRLSELGVFAAVHPKLAELPAAFGLLERVRRALTRSRSLPPLQSPSPGEAYLLGMLYGLHPRTAAAVLRRLDPPRPKAAKLTADLIACRKTARRLARAIDLRQSRIARLLDPLTPEARILLLATLGRGSRRSAVSDYLTASWKVVPSLTGEDLRRLGFRPGPMYRVIFAALRSARLDGQLHTRQDEMSFVLRRFAGASLQH
ncbi:MAG: CCA tRNA nucleotidyltransferase [Candidatus Methylomirabilis oxyfera]|nr:CCA tRNA nucleotidyltransferase [Candidatus Methylomirabilis oxyfera]